MSPHWGPCADLTLNSPLQSGLKDRIISQFFIRHCLFYFQSTILQQLPSRQWWNYQLNIKKHFLTILLHMWKCSRLDRSSDVPLLSPVSERTETEKHNLIFALKAEVTSWKTAWFLGRSYLTCTAPLTLHPSHTFFSLANIVSRFPNSYQM